MTALSALLNEANTDGWSSRAIAARTAKTPWPVGHDTVAKYLRGEHPSTPSENTLRAFQMAFPTLSLEKLRAAAGLPETVTPIVLPPEASRLTPRQWAAVRELILSMVNPMGLSRGSESLPGSERLSLMAAIDAHETSRILPNDDDLEDVEDFLASESDESFMARRAAHGKDPETGLHDDDDELLFADAEGLAEAARDTGELSRGQRDRAAADLAGEPLADDPDDTEPR